MNSSIIDNCVFEVSSFSFSSFDFFLGETEYEGFLGVSNNSSNTDILLLVPRLVMYPDNSVVSMVTTDLHSSVTLWKHLLFIFDCVEKEEDLHDLFSSSSRL